MYGHGSRFRKRIHLVLAVAVLNIYILFKRGTVDNENERSVLETQHDGVFLRHLLAQSVTSTNSPNVTSTSNVTENVTIACQIPAYHEFPRDLFTNHQRKEGAVILHILLALYMLYALAVVCDNYFVASLEKISENLGLSDDVAGATFMAAGSSAPELFASIIGVFIAKGDVGTGTIVGSAVFNILFVIGLCGVLAGKDVFLTWWPLFRDCMFYSLAVITLIGVMADTKVDWWESVLMLLLYAVYIILMKFNRQVRNFLVRNTHLRIMEELTSRSDVPAKNEEGNRQIPTVIFTQELGKINTGRAARYDSLEPNFSPKTLSPTSRFRWAVMAVMEERKKENQETETSAAIITHEVICNGAPVPATPAAEQTMEIQVGQEEATDDWKNVPTCTGDGFVAVVLWVLTVPVKALLYYTVPDCTTDRWQRWFLLTFACTLTWIALLSYVLVWMVVLIGFTFGIPDSVMGITFLAAGSSVPDALSSVIVTKQGQGDMAISNSIGSNVFDILIGLAFPWFLQTVIVNPGSAVHIDSKGMVYNVSLLFFSIILTVCGVHFNRWRLSLKLGLVLLGGYIVFLVFSILIECNVFEVVNPPECVED